MNNVVFPEVSQLIFYCSFFNLILHLSCIFQSFAVEELFTDKNELKESSIRTKVEKAGGANYGTGVRG